MTDRKIDQLYPVKVHFVRSIYKGALAGLNLDSTLGFPDKHSARIWIKGVSDRKFNGYAYSNFKIEDTRQEVKN